jgi:hypothetical protein
MSGVTIEVSDAPVEVAAQGGGGPGPGLIEGLAANAWPHPDDPQVVRAFAHDRVAAAEAMRTVATDPGAAPRRRGGAARVLARRGGDAGPLLALLAGPDAGVRRAALQAIEPPLADATLAAAVRTACGDADGAVREQALWLAARAGVDAAPADGLPFLRERLLGAAPLHATVWALAAFAARPGPSADEAREALRAYVSTREGGRLWRDVAIALAEAPGAADVAVLRGLVERCPDPYVVGRALVGLARVLGADSLPLVRPHLAARRTASHAIEAAGRAAAGTGDSGLVAEIERAADDGPGLGAQRRLDALLTIGGEAGHRAVVRWLVRTRDAGAVRYDAMNAVWVLEGRAAGPALARLHALGVTGALAAPSEPHFRWHPYSAVFHALGGSGLAAFDGEAGRVPCGHDQLLPRFEAASGGAFAPEAAREEYAPEGHRYRLEFVSGGRLYRAHFVNESDYYHSGAVAAAVNRALAEAGAAGRFAPLATGDQGVAFLFAPPAAVAAAAAELLLLTDDGAPLARAVDRLAARWR